MMEELDSYEVLHDDNDQTDDGSSIRNMDDDEDENQRASSSSNSLLQQLVAQRTAFVQVKQEELADDDLATAQPNDHTNNDINNHDPDGHLCVVCMDNERGCLYVPCNHLAVCAECDAGIMATSLPCPMCSTAIDREESVVGGGWTRCSLFERHKDTVSR